RDRGPWRNGADRGGSRRHDRDRDARGWRIRGMKLAERMGFEPTIGLPLYALSRGAPSTTRPPLRLALMQSKRGAFLAGFGAGASLMRPGAGNGGFGWHMGDAANFFRPAGNRWGPAP